MGLTSQSVQWISRQARRVADLRMDGSAGGAKAEGQISGLIHRDTAHPTPGAVRLIRALLPDRDLPLSRFSVRPSGCLRPRPSLPV